MLLALVARNFVLVVFLNETVTFVGTFLPSMASADCKTYIVSLERQSVSYRGFIKGCGPGEMPT